MHFNAAIITVDHKNTIKSIYKHSTCMGLYKKTKAFMRMLKYQGEFPFIIKNIIRNSMTSMTLNDSNVYSSSFV